MENPPLLYNGVGKIFQGVLTKKEIEKNCWQQNYYDYHMYITCFHNTLCSYFSNYLLLPAK